MFGVYTKVTSKEYLIIGGDLNGHVGSESDGYGSVHGGYGFGARNDDGVRILDFAVAAEMVVCNTLFKKENNKLIMYSSGGV